MFDTAQLLGFLAAVVVLVLVPGPNTMLILAQSAVGGRAAGVATVFGIETGTVVHTVAAALGLSAILSTSALAFDVVKYAGAAYLTFAGARTLWRGERSPDEPRALGASGLRRAYWRAALTNVLNPKVALFFLAFLPQFVRPERGHLALQFGVLGLIVAGVGFSFGSLLALAAGTASGWLKDAAFARWQSRVTGSVFLALGLHLALVRRHGWG